MKAAFVKGPSEIEIRSVSRPIINGGEILVKMKACGICGSDLEKIYGKYSQPSMKLGHEPSGVVAEVGQNVLDFKMGDRVFVHHHVPCNSCHFCDHGDHTMCQKYSETNLVPCGLSEEFIVPEWNVSHGGVIKIPDTMTFEEAALIEPMACCIRAWNKCKVRKGDSIAIFGMGATGMMHVMLSKIYGLTDIFCFDVNEFRLGFAKKFQISEALYPSDLEANNKILSLTQNRGVDLAIIATSNLKAFTQSIELVRKGGTIILFGVPMKDEKIPVNMSKIYSKEIRVVPSYAASEEDTNQAFELIKNQKISVKNLITHKFPLEDSQSAIEYAHQGNDSIKIIITNSETLN